MTPIRTPEVEQETDIVAGAETLLGRIQGGPVKVLLARRALIA